MRDGVSSKVRFSRVNQSLFLAASLLWGALGWAQSPDDLDKLEQAVIQARESGDMQKADELAAKLLSLSRQYDHSSLEAEALFLQGRNAMERNQYPKAQGLFSQAITLFQAQGEQTKLGQAYRQLGLTHRYQSNYTVALEYIYLSMQIFEQQGDQAAISDAHNSIGVVLEKLGQLEEAAQAHQHALEINFQLDDKPGIASALYNLGDIRQTMGDQTLALGYFQDALALDLESGNQKNIAYSHNKIGFLLNAMGRHEEARVHLDKALALFQKIQTPRDTDWALSSLAQLEMDVGNLELAKTLIDGVITRAIAHDYHSLLVDAYRIAAELAYRQEDYTLALRLLDEGIEKAASIQERKEEAQLQQLRVKVLLANDALQEAFAALQKQKELDDEILNEKRLDAIARVQAQTEFVRRAHQIELLEKEKALQLAQLKQQTLTRNLWIISLVASFVLLFLLYGRVMQRRTNTKLSEQVALRTQELEQKNRQLAVAYEEMETISLTDKLTGIHNRRFLENHISADLQQSRRLYQDWRSAKTPLPSQADVVVFIIDMDNFKEVNDRFGHGAGDRVLEQLAERMTQVFRQSDYLVRWGGEEFVAVARFVDRQDAAVMARRMVEAVNLSPFQLTDTVSESQTCSIGFACYPLAPQGDYDEGWLGLVGIADACLYRVKHTGKNAWMGVESATNLPQECQDMTSQKLLNLIGKGVFKARFDESVSLED